MASVDEIRAYNRRFLELLRGRAWIRYVVVIAENGACESCASQETIVRREELPVLPHRVCERRGGCGCWYAAVPHRPCSSTKPQRSSAG
jgi:hypothetical protein